MKKGWLITGIILAVIGIYGTIEHFCLFDGSTAEFAVLLAFRIVLIIAGLILVTLGIKGKKKEQ